MRILSYNIWDGGAGRLHTLADVIRAADADAVALQEATPESSAVLASALGMDVVFGEGNSIFDAHVAWLTRLPMRAAANHRLPTLSKSLVEIDFGAVRLFATHLASRHEVDVHPREREIATILDVIRGSNAPHLVVGDFNALDARDAIGPPPPGVEPRGDALPGAARVVLEPLLEAGYVDCFRALHPAAPGWTYPAGAPWLRLDYAFAAPSLAPAVESCDVLDTESARSASDHLPLLVELDVM